MRNVSKILFLCGIIFFMAFSCEENDDFSESDCLSSVFYYYENQKILLDGLNTDYVIIGFYKNTDNQEIIIFINEDLDFNPLQNSDIIQYSEEDYKYVIARFKQTQTCININAKITNLKNFDIVAFTNKTFKTEFFGTTGSYDLMFTTDEFIVKINEKHTLTQLTDLLISVSGTEIKEENEFVKNQYIISTINKNRSTIETANLFYESGIFEFSEPNFAYINF